MFYTVSFIQYVCCENSIFLNRVFIDDKIKEFCYANDANDDHLLLSLI